MAAPDSATQNNARLHLWKFIKVIFIWAAVLYGVNKLLNYAGWEKWDKFEVSARDLDSVMLLKMKKLTPVSLFLDLRSQRTTYPIDTAERNSVDSYNYGLRQKGVGALMELEMQKTYYPKAHEVTAWEKVKSWCVGFWYNEDGSANWFGRIILCIALLAAISLTGSAGQSKSANWLSKWYLPNVLLAIFSITLFFMLLYFIIKFILIVGGSIVALFSGVTIVGGFTKYLVEEVKFEMMVHLKKKVGP
jgi:hypothetical protein